MLMMLIPSGLVLYKYGSMLFSNQPSAFYTSLPTHSHLQTYWTCKFLLPRWHCALRRFSISWEVGLKIAGSWLGWSEGAILNLFSLRRFFEEIVFVEKRIVVGWRQRNRKVRGNFLVRWCTISWHALAASRGLKCKAAILGLRLWDGEGCHLCQLLQLCCVACYIQRLCQV